MGGWFSSVVATPPILLISFGPPASGKGFITALLKDELGMTAFNTSDAIVDNIIEQNPEYQNDMKHCIAEFRRLLPEHKSGNAFPPELLALMKKCESYYWKYRDAANFRNDQIIKDAQKAGRNIVFETTGVNIGWLIEKGGLIDQVRELKYRVILMFPLADINTIMGRLFSRALKIGRLPDPECVIKSTAAIHANFPKLVRIVDVVYVYDNNVAGQARRVFSKNNITGETQCDWKPTEEARFAGNEAYQPTVEVIKSDCSKKKPQKYQASKRGKKKKRKQSRKRRFA